MRADERGEETHREPQPERAALGLPDDPGREAEEEQDDDQAAAVCGHSTRMAQMIATIATMIAMVPAIAVMKPMTTFSRTIGGHHEDQGGEKLLAQGRRRCGGLRLELVHDQRVVPGVPGLSRTRRRGLRPRGRRRAPARARAAGPGAGAGGRARARREGVVGDRREALPRRSRSASSRWAIAVPGGQLGSSRTCTQKQCTRRPPGRTSSAPASPTSHVPRRPRSGTRPVRACTSRASWPTRSPSSPSAVRSGPSSPRGRGARRWRRAGRRARG